MNKPGCSDGMGNCGGRRHCPCPTAGPACRCAAAAAAPVPVCPWPWETEDGIPRLHPSISFKLQLERVPGREDGVLEQVSRTESSWGQFAPPVASSDGLEPRAARKWYSTCRMLGRVQFLEPILWWTGCWRVWPRRPQLAVP